MANGLRRAVGLPTVVANSTGLAFAALEYLVAASLVVYVAGDSAWIAIAVSGLLMVVVRGFFGELNGLFPTAAAIRLWMGKSMDDRVALAITFTYLSTIVLVIGADAYIIGSAIAHTFDQASWAPPIYITVVLALATYTNLRGIRVAGAVQAAVTCLVVVGTSAIILVALGKDGFDLQTPLNPLEGHSGVDFVQAIALGIFLYAAFEWVTTNAEEVRDPALIPRGMLISIGVLFVACSLIALGMSHFLTESELDSSHPQLFLGEAAFGRAGEILMMAITALTALNTFNGGFVTSSRFAYATAREGSLPRVFARLNEKAVPWAPVLALGGVSLIGAIAIALTDEWKFVIAAGAALEAMVYSVAGYCVYRLRSKLPDAERPFRVPGGRAVPLVGSIVFALLALAAATTVDEETNLAPLGLILGFGLLSALYVLIWLPRLRAAEAARRAAAAERRRRRRAASPPRG
jgi:amino acid transporter